MSEAKRMHMNVGINYFRMMHNEGKDITGWLTHGDRDMTPEEILAYLDELEAKGYECVPTCDNVNERGGCAGHLMTAEEETALKERMERHK